MSKFNQQKFNQFILENNVVGFFEKPITLKSGRISHWYVNWRNIAEDVFLLDKLTDFVIDFVQDLNLKPDCFYGVPEGATKLGILTQYKWAKNSPNYGLGSHTLAMGRGKLKDHGEPKDRFFLGQPKGKVVLLEDVTTTGSSLLETIDNLNQSHLQIVAAISLTNRMELTDDKKSVSELVETKGVPYYQMSGALELLPLVYEKLKPEEEIVKKVEEEFQEYGVKKLKLL
ncbi:MAG: Orotate phosphoribosyltransferase [Syntrophomonadaceae bacterium]|nr:Orotate phosphoribosyltransferase [Bacillota bacterium]